MGVKDVSRPPPSRLKREDCKRTKHDSVFSPWQILIGPSDWENYSTGKDGVEKYRTHNLPSRSCPGLYELGIAAIRTGLGRDVRKLDPGHVIVVYLGHTDCVRTRLQHYGRAGSHLEEGKASGYLCDNKNLHISKGPGLFSEIFSRGFPIVFRWARMESKKEAQRTEAQLLGIFDYAWNKDGNGSRRPNDVHIQLDEITSRKISFVNVTRKLKQLMWHHPFGQKQKGITIKAIISPPEDKTYSTFYDRETQNHHLLILRFERWKPRIISDRGNVKEDITEGKPLSSMTYLEDESFRIEFPVLGRNTFELKDEKSFSDLITTLDSEIPREELFTICGIGLGDGSVCENRPVGGRKRCKEHKGKRINRCIMELTDGKVLFCGVHLEDGSICMEIPVKGRKRCELHKGRRLE